MRNLWRKGELAHYSDLGAQIQLKKKKKVEGSIIKKMDSKSQQTCWEVIEAKENDTGHQARASILKQMKPNFR